MFLKLLVVFLGLCLLALGIYSMYTSKDISDKDEKKHMELASGISIGLSALIISVILYMMFSKRKY